MAFGGGGGSGRVKSDINVTPLVDVVLVLLIIFLVAMPIVMRDITIDIPQKLDNPPQTVVQDQQIVEGKCPPAPTDCRTQPIITLNGNPIELNDLATKLEEHLRHISEKVVFVDFDNDYPYGRAVEVMDTCKGAGANTLGIKIKDAAVNQAPAGGAQP